VKLALTFEPPERAYASMMYLALSTTDGTVPATSMLVATEYVCSAQSSQRASNRAEYSTTENACAAPRELST
jgi:hypothetical protein